MKQTLSIDVIRAFFYVFFFVFRRTYGIYVTDCNEFRQNLFMSEQLYITQTENYIDSNKTEPKKRR